MAVGVSDKPLISVVMPVYNAEPYVADAINSILAQTYPHFEFIVIDDGSTDGSAAIVRDFAARDARIRPLFMAHGGIARTMNAGVAEAQGMFIAYIDNDDVALPERLAAQLAWMRRTGVDICGSYTKKFGDRGGFMWFPETHEAIRNELLFRCALLQPTVILRAAIAKAYPYNDQVHFADYELWTRLAPRYRLGNMPQILLKYRRHPQQTHVRDATAFREDLRKYREPYFYTLFPEASAEDYATVARIADQEPFSSIADLEQAGMWLLRLAQTPDRFLRERMARRWWTACLKSAHLGAGCHRLYRQVAPRFGVAIDEGIFPV
jgi:glycosyltransferase involved in cell wall biosynthesis